MKINLKNKKKTKVDQESIWYIHFNLISENETGNKLRVLLRQKHKVKLDKMYLDTFITT
jgi:hypothetical protein